MLHVRRADLSPTRARVRGSPVAAGLGTEQPSGAVPQEPNGVALAPIGARQMTGPGVTSVFGLQNPSRHVPVPGRMERDEGVLEISGIGFDVVCVVAPA